jgi:hypothetical protein
MVHSHLGSAAITYPRGVTVSSADPMTSANLPARLRLVPGGVSRPVRIGDVDAPYGRYPNGQPIGPLDKLLLGSAYYAPDGGGAATPAAATYYGSWGAMVKQGGTINQVAPTQVPALPPTPAPPQIPVLVMPPQPAPPPAPTAMLVSPTGPPTVDPSAMQLAVTGPAPAAGLLSDVSQWPTWYWVVGGGALLLLVVMGGRKR